MSSTSGQQALAAVAGRRPGPTGWARGDCPFCEGRTGKADRKQSLGVNFRTGGFNCFKCSARGRAAEGYEQHVPVVHEPEKPAERPTRPEGFYPLFEGPGLTAQVFEDARAYVRARGLGDAVAREANVGACARGRFAGRVVVPVFSPAGDWMWHVGRAWSKGAEKPYLYPSGNRMGLLYNQAALARETDEPVLVVEGVFDALAFWPDAVAVLGKPTEDHIASLVSARRPVAIVLDGDAWEEGEALSWRLRLEGQRAGSVKLAPRVDPDECDKAELLAAARASLDEP